MAQPSKIFARYKTLGYVSNHIPVTARYIQRRHENLLTTCVGKSFHTYGSSRLTLLTVSELLPDEITCMTANNYLLFTACEHTIYAWRRGFELKYTYNGHTSAIHSMLCFDRHLLSIDQQNILKVWDIKGEDQIMELNFDEIHFKITTIMHPSTYINKILMGSEQGSLQLWNILTSTLIYSFQGWGSRVSVLEQAPAVDVVAVGLNNGHIILHNLKYDETIMQFLQDWGTVTTISFRTDNHPIMLSGTTSGHIISWDLEERKLSSQLLNAHKGPVCGLHCFTSEPLMVTNSSDNSLKIWIFDMPDGSPRLLIKREGHALPPTRIRFHGSSGDEIISSGGDSDLRIFSTVSETFNKSLGRASYERKKAKRKGNTHAVMPPILSFASELTREKEWDNIAAIHCGISVATTWSSHKNKMGELKLLHDRFKKRSNLQKFRIAVEATCINITPCGHFVLIGYSTGHCDQYNMQSGLYRASYGQPLAHMGAVRGIAVDNLNQTVTTGGADQKIKWWPFKASTSKTKLKKDGSLETLLINESVAFFTTHRESALISVALDDFTILVVDIESKSIIRKFEGHSGRLTDATFSPDARWLVTAAMDCTIKTWDLPAGCLVDQMKVDAACTSISFSATGELLATSHVNYLGIFLWCNRTLVNHVSLKPILVDENLETIELITNQTLAQVESNDALNDIEEEFENTNQINKDLVTLSLLPNSRWQNLLNIDLVKKRNKPKQPVKAPKAAPFFLPTIPSLSIEFDVSGFAEEVGGNRSYKYSETFTAFGNALRKSVETLDFQILIQKMKNMGPSTIDFEINSLNPEAGGSEMLLIKFLRLVEIMLESNQDFELAQSYLGLFLKIYGNYISNNQNLWTIVKELQSKQLAGWKRIQDKLFYNLCVLQSLKL